MAQPTPLWVTHLRANQQAMADFLLWCDQAIQETTPQFRRATNFEGISKIQGRIEGIDLMVHTVTQLDKEQRDAAERHAQRERAAAGILHSGAASRA